MKLIISFIMLMTIVGPLIVSAETLPKTAAELISTADRRIASIRKSQMTVVVQNVAGKPVKGALVHIKQSRHAFLFGCNIFPLVHQYYKGEQYDQYAKEFSDLLNYATLPFYWGAYESTKGAYGVAEMNNKRIARWCAQQGITTKGHPLIWHEVLPSWVAGNPDETRTLLEKRVKEIVSGFKGLIDRWDVVNEATVSTIYDNGVGHLIKKDGTVKIVGEALDWAHEANPKAMLLYNDFNTGADMDKLVSNLADSGKPMDAIGIQSHMHAGEWTLERVWEVCEQFGRFGKPIHFTELTVLSGEHGWEQKPWPTTLEGEAFQAEYVEKLYTLLFSHPAVQAITWWDFMDGGWQGAPAGLVRADLSLKPVYNRLMHLIKGKWWTKADMRTDPKGTCTLRAFRGDYGIVVEYKDKKADAEFELTQSKSKLIIKLL